MLGNNIYRLDSESITNAPSSIYIYCICACSVLEDSYSAFQIILFVSSKDDD
uniref:Uncharacterized protein n=1 Tax=Onchocerca volvulus TaxID=6282 RepID=A0A8R1XX72_ONCVO